MYRSFIIAMYGTDLCQLCQWCLSPQSIYKSFSNYEWVHNTSKLREQWYTFTLGFLQWLREPFQSYLHPLLKKVWELSDFTCKTVTDTQNMCKGIACYLSGKFWRGDVIRTLLITLYSRVSQWATKSTTTSLARTGNMWVGIPCQKWSRKLSTYRQIKCSTYSALENCSVPLWSLLWQHYLKYVDSEHDT